MAQVRNIKQTNNDKKIEESIAGMTLDQKFKNRVTTKLTQYKKINPNVNTIELNYCLCWGFARQGELVEFISNTRKTIENINAFIEQENNSGKNSYNFTLKVRLYPNERLKDAEKVKECDRLASDLLIDLRSKNQLVDMKEWRLTDKARIAADAAFDGYYANETIKTNLDAQLETDSVGFLKKYTDHTKEECFAHYITETKDILALMQPREVNEYAKDVDVDKNKFIIVLSEHDLCHIMYTIRDNAQDLGYDSKAFCTLKPPSRIEPEVSHHVNRTVDFPLNHSTSNLRSDSLNIPYHSKTQNRKRKSNLANQGFFHSANNSPNCEADRHKSHSSSSSSSDNPSPKGSLTSSPNSSSKNTPNDSAHKLTEVDFFNQLVLILAQNNEIPSKRAGEIVHSFAASSSYKLTTFKPHEVQKEQSVAKADTTSFTPHM